MAKHSEAEQAGILVLGKVTATITQAILPWIIVRLMGKADVGAFAALMLIYTTLATLMTAGFPPAILYFNAHRNIEERKSVSYKIYRLMIFLSIITSGILFTLSYFNTPITNGISSLFSLNNSSQLDAITATLNHLKYFSLFPILDMPTRVLTNLLISEHRTRSAASFGIVRAFGMTISALIPTALGYGLDGIIFGFLIFGVLQSVAMLFLLMNIYGNIRAKDDDLTVKSLFGFAVPLGLTDIVNLLNSSLDSYLILGTMSAAVFAEYRMGAWQIPLVTSTAYSVGTVYLPRFAKLIKQNNSAEVINLWRKAVEKVSLIVVPVCLVFIIGAEEFVTLAFTSDYIRAANIFRLYSILTMARVTSFGSILTAAGKPKFVLYSSLLTILSNAAVSIPLLIYFGFIGPALGTAIVFIPTVMIYCYFISKALNVRFLNTFPLVTYLKIVSLGIIPSILAIAVKLLLPHNPGLALTLEAIIILLGFSIIGTLTNYITKKEWLFVVNWIRLKVLTQK